MEQIKDQFGQTQGIYRYGDDVYLIDDECIHTSPTLLPLVAGREITTDKIVFLLCRKGHISLKLNYRRLHLMPRQAIIILPQMIIETLEVSGDAQVHTLLLSERFTDSLNLGGTYRTLLSVRHQPLLTLPAEVDSSLLSLYTMVRGLLTAPAHPNLDRVLHLLFEAYFYGIDPYLHTAPSAVVASAAEQHTDEFLKLVEKNFRRQHSLDWYATLLNITPKRLGICVKQTTSRTATSWIERHRMLEACRLLQGSAVTIKEVAAALDFPTPSAFGTWFRRMTGLAPGDYRRQSASDLHLSAASANLCRSL